MDIGNFLENAPKGLWLYSPAFGDLKLVSIDKVNRDRKATPMIRCERTGASEKLFFRDGSISTHGECMLFPSSKHRTWEGWQNVLFKPGTVINLINDTNGNINIPATALYKGENHFGQPQVYDFEGKLHDVSLAGYKFADTMTVGEFFSHLCNYGYEWDINTKKIVPVSIETVNNIKETNELLESIMKEKKKNTELKTFDKVLYIPEFGSAHDTWMPGFVERVMKGNFAYIMGLDKTLKYCIPYEGNEKLLFQQFKEENLIKN